MVFQRMPSWDTGRRYMSTVYLATISCDNQGANGEGSRRFPCWDAFM